MKKIIFLILLVFLFFVAYSTKPDYKTCVMACVEAVWGRFVPDTTKPAYYEQFFDATSKAVKIDDWFFLERIQYKLNTGYTTIGYGAFKKVFIVSNEHL